MALSATDRFRIINNIIARYGGMDGIDLKAELAKAEAQINQMDDMNVNNPITGQNNGLTAPISPEGYSDTTQGEIMPETSPEQPQTGSENMV